jgi:hypothetical protein
MREEHRLLFGPASKDILDGYDQANQSCGEVIAKFRQSCKSSERSSSLLVVVVCPQATMLPIQLSKDDGGPSQSEQGALTAPSRKA